MSFYKEVLEIDKIIMSNDKSMGRINTIHNLIKNPELANYFWRHLEDKDWLPILQKFSFFTILKQSAEGNNKIFQIQASISDYVAKVGEFYPKEVIQIIKNSNSDNYLVVRNFIIVCYKFEAKYTAKLMPQFKRWINNSNFMNALFEVEIIKLFKHLVDGGETDSALKFLKIITSPKKQIPLIKRNKKNEKVFGKNHPIASPVIEYYYLKEFLTKGLDNLIEKKNIEVSQILAFSLEKAIKIEFRYVKDGSDLSYLWRAAIEDHKQNYEYYELKGALLIALRSSLENLVFKNKKVGLNTIESYLNHRFSIFRRLAIHLLRLNYKDYMGFIKQLIKDKSLLTEIDISHEYYILLKDIYQELSNHQKEFILNSIISFENFDSDVKPEIQEKQKRYYWFQKLYFFRNSLEGWHKVLYEELNAEFMEENIYDTPVWHESYSGERSPITIKELEEKNNNELWQYLRSFRPAKRVFDAPSIEGLARIFGELANKNFVRFLSSDINPLLDLPPNYSYWFFHHLAEQLKGDSYGIFVQHIDNLISICTRLMRIENIPNHFIGDLRINFTAVKKRILDVVQALIKSHQREFSIDYKDQIWQIIEYLCYYEDDPNVSQEKDSNFDPFTLALNSVRGTAMHTLIDYALWYAFHNKVFQKGENPNRFTGEERIQYLLEEKLNKKSDSSLAVFSTFGIFLPNLAYLNFNWMIENMEKIFPNEKEYEKYWATAWAGYINASRFYSDLYKLLKPQFERAIDILLKGNTLIPSGFGRTPEDALSEHLIVACLNELDNITNKNSLLRNFIEIPNNPSATHAVLFIGNLAKDQMIFQDLSELERKSFWPQAKKFWEIRIDVVKKELKKNERSNEEDEFDREFSTYVNWLDDLPPNITLKELMPLLSESIKINRRGWYLPEFIKYLSQQSEASPIESINLLFELIKTDMPTHFYHGKEKEIEAILENSIKTKKPEAYYYADLITNKFGIWGNYYFKEFWIKHLKSKEIKKLKIPKFEKV